MNNDREIRFIYCSLFATVVAFAGLFSSLAAHAGGVHQVSSAQVALTTTVFVAVMLFIAYGNFLYQFCLLGYHKRQMKHRPATREELDSFYDKKAPSLAILIPSYKEEISIVRQTMLSAALSEYPQKSVVLLIDDPQLPQAREDALRLEETRQLPKELQALLHAQLAHHRAQEVKFAERCKAGKMIAALEMNRLALSYESVAKWLEKLAVDGQGSRCWDSLSHGEQFFFSKIILEPASAHHAYARQLWDRIAKGQSASQAYLACQYARLCGIFDVSFRSFERKKYVNLSQESNKAMNLNSYIGLMGKSWREVETRAGLELHECDAGSADFTMPGFDFVNTIDADTLMTSDYVLRLIHEMQKPGRERLAVAQSPCSSIPGCPNALERAAGAFLDVQFYTHQGYTHWGASFWVGANAVLRRNALEEIKETRMENGHEIAIYIQDRTVIEDTESSIDLVFKGWQIYNYPQRMTFSAMPSDFGSLLIQRRRWANGGLIILPKLIGYMLRSPKNFQLLKEFLIRFNYLASTTLLCIAAFTSMVYPFEGMIASYWLPLSGIPFFLLLMRDLHKAGYRPGEILRVYAVNLMLLPINTGGVLKQFQQIATGKKIPFGRTPKVPGRTVAPLLYYLLEILMLFGFAGMSLHNAEQAHWAQAAFCAANAAAMMYVLVCLIGFDAMIQDTAASLAMQRRKLSDRARMVALPLRRLLISGFTLRME